MHESCRSVQSPLPTTVAGHVPARDLGHDGAQVTAVRGLGGARWPAPRAPSRRSALRGHSITMRTFAASCPFVFSST